MATDTLNLFNSFKEAIFESVHDFSSDTIKAVLTATAPNATNTQLSNITQIASGNGYVTGGATAAISSSSQTGGTYTLVVGDVTWTATGGALPSFRYAVYYNDTAASDELIGWVDYGSAVTPASGESFTLDATTAGIITASG